MIFNDDDWVLEFFFLGSFCATFFEGKAVELFKPERDFDSVLISLSTYPDRRVPGWSGSDPSVAAGAAFDLFLAGVGGQRRFLLGSLHLLKETDFNYWMNMIDSRDPTTVLLSTICVIRSWIHARCDGSESCRSRGWLLFDFDDSRRAGEGGRCDQIVRCRDLRHLTWLALDLKKCCCCMGCRVGRRAITVAAGTWCIYIILQLLERLIPGEWHCAAATNAGRFKLRFAAFTLMLLMQI